MKHIEELKIGATAIVFCMIMLLVYAVFPQDGFVPSTKAPMPERPSAESLEEEEDYGFQIYTQESNYDDSYSSDSYEEDSSYEAPQGAADTDTSTEPDTGNDPSQDSAAPDTGAEEEPPVSNEPDPDISYVEEPSVDESYDIESEADEGSYEDGINWNETEATYHYEE